MKIVFYTTFVLGSVLFFSCETKKEPSLLERFVDAVEEASEEREEARNKEYSLDENGRITATDLVWAYDGNELRADATFKDSIFTVVGKIDEIGRDAFEGTPVVDLRGNGLFDIVQCFFTEEDELTRFNVGNKVRITGRCAGKNGFIEMHECSAIELIP